MTLYGMSRNTGKGCQRSSQILQREGCYTRLVIIRKKHLSSVVGIGLIVACLLLLLMVRQTSAPSKSTAPNQSANGSQQGRPTALDFNKTEFSTTDPASPWVIVNKQHPLQPLDYAPGDLTTVGNGQQMRTEAAEHLLQMIADAKAARLTIYAASGYRSYSTQVNVYANEVKSYGQAVADSESARPGYSEHQTGWAVDIGGGGCNITDCFGSTAEGKWTAANAYRYGFILRYTPADSSVTGYRAESWHFRYVGMTLSTYMHSSGTATLEEVFGVSGGSTYKS